MSYDLAVFDPSAAPLDRAEFLEWFRAQLGSKNAANLQLGAPMPFDVWIEALTGGAQPDGPTNSRSPDVTLPRGLTSIPGGFPGGASVRRIEPLGGAGINPFKLEEWIEARMPELARRNDPQTASPPLRSWFAEISRDFPPMNGPNAIRGSDSAKVTDYDIVENVIYCAFAWSVARQAYEQVVRLARKHRVGFFDASGDGEIWRPADPT